MRAVSAILATAPATTLATGLASGKDCKGVSFPDQVQIDGSTLTLNGLGLRQATAFKVNVYVVALYVPKASSDPAVLLSAGGPKELVLQFVRNVDSDDLKKAWAEGFEKNAKADLPALKESLAVFNGWMSDMKTGQRLTFVHKPGAGVDVNVNGTAKGTIRVTTLPRRCSRSGLPILRIRRSSRAYSAEPAARFRRPS